MPRPLVAKRWVGGQKCCPVTVLATKCPDGNQLAEFVHFVQVYTQIKDVAHCDGLTAMTDGL